MAQNYIDRKEKEALEHEQKALNKIATKADQEAEGLGMPECRGCTKTSCVACINKLPIIVNLS